MISFFKKLSVQRTEDEAIKRAIGRVIDGRTYFAQPGPPHIKKLEEALSRRVGDALVIAVNSGTDALILAMRALGIGDGDEVIVPAFSFISSASAVAWTGAVPVFADIKEEDYALDPAKIEKKITHRTKAVILVHLFGQPALGTEEILEIAKRRSLFVIEDAAQAVVLEAQAQHRARGFGERRSRRRNIIYDDDGFRGRVIASRCKRAS